MRRSVVRILGVPLVAATLGGCASGGRARSADPTAERPSKATEKPAAGLPQEEAGVHSIETPGTYPKVPANSAPAPAPHDERPRSVTLPDAVEVATQAAALPATATIAVAFVRAGKLVRCDRALRRLDHELGRDQGATVVALEPLGKDVPDSVTLEQLAEAASSQRAHLLLVDVRDDDQDAESTTFVLHAGTRKFLAHTKAKATAPAGTDLVARLVVSARKQG